MAEEKDTPRRSSGARKRAPAKKPAARGKQAASSGGAKAKPASAKAKTTSSRKNAASAKGTSTSARAKSGAAKPKSGAAKTKASAKPAAQARAKRPSSPAQTRRPPLPERTEEPPEARAEGTERTKSAAEEFPTDHPTAPSLGPHTVIEREPVEERLARHDQSEVDALGKDKRRAVVGKTYGPTFARQASLYGAFLAVVAVLAFGFIKLAQHADEPPASNPAKAPWATTPDVKQHPPKPLDFPRYGD
jgi:hypothetical protein